MSDHLHQLGDLLAEAGARVSFAPVRVAPSTLYDIDYHVAIIACALSIYGASQESKGVVISPALLKLLQFVSARPSLLPRTVSWLEQRKQRTLETISDMPRGYIGDRTHDRAVSYLIARGTLRHHGNNLASGPTYKVLSDLQKQVEALDLFSSERRILSLLVSYRIPQVALEGR